MIPQAREVAEVAMQKLAPELHPLLLWLVTGQAPRDRQSRAA